MRAHARAGGRAVGGAAAGAVAGASEARRSWPSLRNARNRRGGLLTEIHSIPSTSIVSTYSFPALTVHMIISSSFAPAGVFSVLSARRSSLRAAALFSSSIAAVILAPISSSSPLTSSIVRTAGVATRSV